MTLYLTIRKAQGENRRPGPDGNLKATQHTMYFAEIRVGSLTAHGCFWSRRKGSATLVRKELDAAFGAPLYWRDASETEGMYDTYGTAEVEIA